MEPPHLDHGRGRRRAGAHVILDDRRRDARLCRHHARRHGRSVAQSQLSSPAFTCSLPSATRSMLAEFPHRDAPSWRRAHHQRPMDLPRPPAGLLHRRSDLRGGSADGLHRDGSTISDIGGRLDEFDARDVYEEGLRIPPSKLYSEGNRTSSFFGSSRRISAIRGWYWVTSMRSSAPRRSALPAACRVRRRLRPLFGRGGGARHPLAIGGRDAQSHRGHSGRSLRTRD